MTSTKMIKVTRGILNQENFPDLVLEALKDAASRGWILAGILPTPEGCVLYVQSEVAS